MLAQLGIAIVTFVITNIDDLLILSIYFANPSYSAKNIVAGQYLGITTLITMSLSGLILETFLAHHWISLLGLLPLGIGIKDLVQLQNKDTSGEEELPERRSNLQYINVAFVTIANGGDNIGVYAPVFANLETPYLYLYVLVFFILTAVWCLLAYVATSHRRVKLIFSKFGKIILPAFLILLGLFIMKDFCAWIMDT